jgi:hypothetical protein
LTASRVEQNRRAVSARLPQQGFADRKILFAPIQFGELRVTHD